MKKVLKVLGIIVLLLIVLWCIIFTIDYIKCSNFKMPIFVIPGETADDGGYGTYYGLGYKVEIEKHLSAKYGAQLTKVEMYMFNKFLTGAIVDTANSIVDETNYSDNINKVKESFVGTVLEETTKYMIVEPNEDEVERKSSDRIVINYGYDHNDYLYGIGRKVRIYYNGYIMETYPAQINSDKIETLD